MDVLVTIASKHGSTFEIAEVIATSLQARGLVADVRRVEDVVSLAGVQAVVLGSGVYAGHWLRAARDFAERHEGELREMPVWLFSSGPLGEPPRPFENPAEVAALSKRLGSRGHRLFAGRVEGAELGLAERALVKLVRAPSGDFRPWSEITAWAATIADSLTASPIAPGVP